MAIARRVLTLRTEAGNAGIEVLLFAPEQTGEGDWLCRCEIGWPDRRHLFTAGGFDSMQALVCALQMIAANLYASDEHRAGHLVWGAPEEGYGFPVVRALRDQLRGNDAKFF
jgi:hypothetical protein